MNLIFIYFSKRGGGRLLESGARWNEHSKLLTTVTNCGKFCTCSICPLVKKRENMYAVMGPVLRLSIHSGRQCIA